MKEFKMIKVEKKVHQTIKKYSKMNGTSMQKTMEFFADLLDKEIVDIERFAKNTPQY
jgi:hypothetical protein